MRVVGAVFLAVWSIWLFSQPALAEKRVALVMGNSAYRNVNRLANPANDSEAMAAILKKAGFDVVELKRDLTVSEMRRALRDFSDTVRDADIAIVYFAGHGIEIDGTNYVIPVDAVLERDIDAFDEAIPLDRILTVIEPAKQLRLVILDACRDNPFNKTMKRSIGSRAIGRGLAKVEPESPNTLIAFAAKAGSTASDGDSKNSPFTAALVKYLPRPGLDLRRAFGYARDDVLKATDNKQEPFIYGSLGGDDVALVPAPSKTATDTAKPLDETRLELAFWESIKNEKNPELFQAYLNRYPKGVFADIATINLKQQRTAALESATVEQPNDKVELSDAASLREVREKLYELNFDPGSLDGPMSTAVHQAIREFERANQLASTGEVTQGLLRRLRDISGLKPWGAIVYSKATNKWGMAWSEDTRKAAVASAQASCGAASQCSTEISFFGTECGVFAHSDSSWAIVARADIQNAKDDALSGCRKRGNACHIIASVCADGAQRLLAANDVALAPAVVPPPHATSVADPVAAAKSDYEIALKVDEPSVWDSFIRNHPSGFYTDVAKARRDKFVAEQARVAATQQAKAAQEEQTRVASEGAEAAKQAEAALRARVAEQARVAAELANKGGEAKVTEAERAKATALAKTAGDLEPSEDKLKKADEAKADEEAKPAAAKMKDDRPIGPVAALTPSDDAAPRTPDSGQPALGDIPRLLQTELRRVGCNIGSVGNNWGEAAQKSLSLFNKNAGMKLDVKVASLDALDAVRSKTGRICPLICDHGYQADGERCVKITCRAGYRVDDDNECEKEHEKPIATHEAPRSKSDQPQREKVEEKPSRQTAQQIICGSGGCRPVGKGCRLEYSSPAGKSTMYNHEVCN